MTIWLVSDWHLGQESFYSKHRDADGRFVRYEFASAEEADEAMIERHNALVKTQDHVYVAGDIAMKRKDLEKVKRFNGKLRYVGGNHDIYDFKSYREVGFQKVFGVRVMNNVLITHMPVHPTSLGRFLGNAHGHTHRAGSPSGTYTSLCVELNGYQPVTLEEISGRLRSLRDNHEPATQDPE